jgi:hypothetical protein
MRSAIQTNAGRILRLEVQFASMPIMTPEEQARLRQLPRLIAEENDPEKMKVLAAELERLLILEGRIKRSTEEGPRSS